VNDELHLPRADIFLQQSGHGLTEVPLTEWTEIVGVLHQGQRGIRLSPKRMAIRREPDRGALIRLDRRDLLDAGRPLRGRPGRTTEEPETCQNEQAPRRCA
jgi:hypothetical protein